MFLISTNCGMCPNICSDIFKNDRIFFIDDFIYRNSIFYHQEISLRNFCNIDDSVKIYLLFKTDKKKSKGRVVCSKRGDMVLSEEEYEKFVKILDPDFYQDFSSNDLVVDREGKHSIVRDCKEIADFIKEHADFNKETLDFNKEKPDSNKETIDSNKETIDFNKEKVDSNKKVLFGTTFINELSKNGNMLKISDSKLVISSEVFDCSCCGKLQPGYLKHLKDMREINFLYYITVHNYNTLDKFIRLPF